MFNDTAMGDGGEPGADETRQPQITPRASVAARQRLGDFDTLSEGLDYAAKGETGFNFYSPRGQLEEVLSYAELRRRARETGRRLLAAGLKRGERVAVVAETGSDFMAVFFGCQYAGLIPCPMPYSLHIGGREAYVERIAGMMMSAHASAAITCANLRDHVAEAAKAAGVDLVLSHAELAGIATKAVKLKPFKAHEAAYIQYSSGSTSRPKGVLISQRAATANTRAILQHGLKVRRDDRAFSWLPLYHDMGLVGFCLSPMMGQVSVDYLSTPSFARRPALWLKLMSDNRCTIAYSPSFGYELAARRINGGAVDLDLSHWRVAGIGGDMVRPDVLDLFTDKLEVAGFDAKAFLPSYGMAESTLAITFADLDAPVAVDVVDRRQCKLAGRAVPVEGDRLDKARRRSFVVCGRPLPGHEIRICGGDGRVLGDREIGHIMLKGPSLMEGYYRNAESTAAVMREDGFMSTGDLGYWLDGQIVITGRAKDLILHNGRNIWPQDIEWAVEHVEALRSANVAAFAVEDEAGGDHVVVLVECRVKNPPDIEDLRRQASVVVHNTAGVECEIVMVPPKSLPFTSSGKLSRASAKARYLRGDIAALVPAPGARAQPMPHAVAVAG